MQKPMDAIVPALLAAVGTEAMNEALRALGEAFGATTGHVLIVRTSTQELLMQPNFVADGHEPAVQQYSEQWMPRDPRVPLLARRPGQLLNDAALFERAFTRSSVFYNEFLNRNKVHHNVFGSEVCEGDVSVLYSLLRPIGAEPYSLADQQRLQAMWPSVMQAMRLHYLTAHLRQRADDARAALDRTALPMAVVDEQCRVQLANAAFEQLLRDGTSLNQERGVIRAAPPSVAARLEELVLRAARMAQPRSRAGTPLSPWRGEALRMARAHAPPLTLTVHPLLHGAVLPAGTPPNGRALLVVYDPLRVVELDVARVAEHFQLTATEAELAVALAEGRTLTNFAAQRGCTEHTARTHLKRVFAKTGAVRQAELVRLLLSASVVWQFGVR